MKVVPRARHENGPKVDDVLDWIRQQLEEDSIEEVAIAMTRRGGGMSWWFSAETRRLGHLRQRVNCST